MLLAKPLLKGLICLRQRDRMPPTAYEDEPQRTTKSRCPVCIGDGNPNQGEWIPLPGYEPRFAFAAHQEVVPTAAADKTLMAAFADILSRPGCIRFRPCLWVGQDKAVAIPFGSATTFALRVWLTVENTVGPYTDEENQVFIWQQMAQKGRFAVVRIPPSAQSTHY